MISYICGSKVDILGIADDFKEAYNRCVEVKNVRKDEYGRTTGDVVNVPAIVNCAFACELYLRTITNSDMHTHQIKDLFLLLPKEDQEYLRAKIEPILPTQYGLDFDGCIDEISNSFVNWRYIYKQDGVGTLGLNGTLNLLPKLMEELSNLAHKNDSKVT